MDQEGRKKMIAKCSFCTNVAMPGFLKVEVIVVKASA